MSCRRLQLANVCLITSATSCSVLHPMAVMYGPFGSCARAVPLDHNQQVAAAAHTA
jgi:hypothetical protein